MKLQKVTPELRNEILTSINSFDQLLQKEISFSVDLRKHNKIILYTNKIIELQQSLIKGWI